MVNARVDAMPSGRFSNFCRSELICPGASNAANASCRGYAIPKIAVYHNYNGGFSRQKWWVSGLNLGNMVIESTDVVISMDLQLLYDSQVIPTSQWRAQPPLVHFQATNGGYRRYPYIIIYSPDLPGMLKKYLYKYAFDTNSIFLWQPIAAEVRVFDQSNP